MAAHSQAQLWELALHWIFTGLHHIPHCRVRQGAELTYPHQRRCPLSTGVQSLTDLFLNIPRKRPSRDWVRNYLNYGRKLTSKCQDKTTKWGEDRPR